MHVLKTILFVFLTFLSTSLIAQNKSKSLKRSSEKADTEVYLEEADRLKNDDPSASLDQLERALAVSIENKDVVQEGRCYILIGEINENIQEWNLAKENYEKAFKIFVKDNSQLEFLKKSLTGLGNAYMNLGDYASAQNYYSLLLKNKENYYDEWNALLLLSELLYRSGKYEQALSYADRAEKAAEKLRYKSIPVEIQNQKAKIYASINELDKAQMTYNKSLNQNNDFEEPAILSTQKEAKEEIIKGLRSQNRSQEEIDLRNNTIQQNINLNRMEDVTKDKVELGKFLIEQGNANNAIRELEEAVVIADSIGSVQEQARANLSLAEAYKSVGNNAAALRSYEKYSEVAGQIIQEKDSQLASRSEILRKQKSIEGLTKDFTIDEQSFKLKETEGYLERSMIARQRLVIYGLLVIMLIIVVTSYFVFKSARASKLANQLLALKSLRSQMNPHFIFNALNSVNQFISQSDERAANKFLADFSKLMRMVLDHSQEDFITLAQEKEVISLYLKLEHYRFREKFEYNLDIRDQIDLDAFRIPPMLIQPYIENAIWHGLRYKKDKGKLDITICEANDFLEVSITDDGIGRKKSVELKTENQKKHNSRGLKNIEERLHILNKVYHTRYKVTVEDLDPKTGEGTKVSIFIPNHIHDKN